MGLGLGWGWGWDWGLGLGLGEGGGVGGGRGGGVGGGVGVGLGLGLAFVVVVKVTSCRLFSSASLRLHPSSRPRSELRAAGGCDAHSSSRRAAAASSGDLATAHSACHGSSCMAQALYLLGTERLPSQ